MRRCVCIGASVYVNVCVGVCVCECIILSSLCIEMT